MSGFVKRDLDRARAIMRALPAEARKGIEDALDKGAEEIAERARILAPVDTGELRGAIEVRDNLKGFSATGAIGNFARLVSGQAGKLVRFIGVFPASRSAPGWYAAWVEFGTVKSPAQPFLGPAFFGSRKRIQGRVSRALSKAAKMVVAGVR